MPTHGLLIAVNKYASVRPLEGCINDVEDMASYLEKLPGFANENLKKLVDNDATKEAILEEARGIIGKLKSGDRFFLHFSGHGTRCKDVSQNRLMDAICPQDIPANFTAQHLITENDLIELFSALPGGVVACFCADSCHSGHMRELPADSCRSGHMRDLPADSCYSGHMRDLPADSCHSGHMRELSAAGSTIRYVESTHADGVPSAWTMGKEERAPFVHFRNAILGKRDISQIYLLAACRSDRIAAEATFNGKANGAFTRYLLECIKDGGKLSDVIREVGKRLKDGGHEQVPQYRGDPLATVSDLVVEATN